VAQKALVFLCKSPPTWDPSAACFLQSTFLKVSISEDTGLDTTAVGTPGRRYKVI
jgi:hypothetical protein